jgi:hypothetical protein
MNKDSEKEHQAKLSLEAYLANASNRDNKESLLKKIKFNAVELCELMNIPLIPIGKKSNGLDGEEGGVALREEACGRDSGLKSLERIDPVVEDVQEIDHVVGHENHAGTLEKKSIHKRDEDMVQKDEKVPDRPKGLPEKNHSLIIEHYLNHIASDLSRPKLSNEDEIPFVIDRNPDPDLAFKNNVMSFPKSLVSEKLQSNEADVEETIMEDICVPSIQPSVLSINNKKQSLSNQSTRPSSKKEVKTQPDQKNEKKDKEKSSEKSRERKSEISIDFLPDTHRDIVPDQNPETFARLKTHESFLEQFISLWDLSISLDSSLEWRNLLEMVTIKNMVID